MGRMACARDTARRPDKPLRGTTRCTVHPNRLVYRIPLSSDLRGCAAATWLARAGVDLWKAAGLLGMTVETLQRVYAHHHPDYLRDAAEALGRQNGDRLTVNKRRQTQSNVTKITEKSKAAW